MQPQDSNNPQNPDTNPNSGFQNNSFAGATGPDQSAGADQPPSTIVSPPSGGGMGKKLLFVLFTLIIFAGAGFGIYSLTQKDSKDQNNMAAQKQDIAQLNVGVIGGSIALYPQSTSDSYAQTISQQVYEGLVAYEDQTKIDPLLATGWNNPDSSTWDFSLRKNVTFHNGHTMKADDVVASLEAAKANEDLGLYNDTLGEIKALDDYKVRIKTTAPDPFLLNKLSYLMILDADDLEATDTSNATGPYQLKDGTEVTDTEIQLTAYDKYHGGHVYVRGLKITSEPDEATATKDFKAGKINMVGEYPKSDPDQLNGVKAQKIVVEDPAVTFMTVNSVASGPLQNLKVRQALQYSLDIPTIISESNTSAEPASQLVTKAIPGYDPSLEVVSQNIKKAKQLLIEAGYPSGVTLNLEISTQNKSVADSVAKQAKEAGFTINIVEAPSFDVQVNNLLAGKTQLSILSYSSDLLDSSEVFDSVLRQTSNYKSSALDKYLEDAASTVDQEKRLKELQQASKVLYDDVAAIPLFNRQRTWFTDKAYAIQFDTLSSDPGVYFWKAYLTN